MLLAVRIEFAEPAPVRFVVRGNNFPVCQYGLVSLGTYPFAEFKVDDVCIGLGRAFQERIEVVTNVPCGTLSERSCCCSVVLAEQ